MNIVYKTCDFYIFMSDHKLKHKSSLMRNYTLRHRVSKALSPLTSKETPLKVESNLRIYNCLQYCSSAIIQRWQLADDSALILRMQLIDVMGAAQTVDSHEAAMQVLNFKNEESLDLNERYLWSLSLGAHPPPHIIEGIFYMSIHTIHVFNEEGFQ